MSQLDRDEAKSAVRTLLEWIERSEGEFGPREGLIDTPERVVSMFDEIFSGYTESPAEILDSTFNGEGYDGIVLLKDIEFHSTCEHHLQPFSGRAHVAYIPVDRIVGISKLARLTDIHAKRLQNQERITKGIADDLEEHVKPLGCAVIMEARHGCAELLGIETNAVTTSAMRGYF